MSEQPTTAPQAEEREPYTEISVTAYNIRKLPRGAADKVKERIADELREAIWDHQDDYDRDEEEELAEFDIHSTVTVTAVLPPKEGHERQGEESHEGQGEESR